MTKLENQSWEIISSILSSQCVCVCGGGGATLNEKSSGVDTVCVSEVFFLALCVCMFSRFCQVGSRSRLHGIPGCKHPPLVITVVTARCQVV